MKFIFTVGHTEEQMRGVEISYGLGLVFRGQDAEKGLRCGVCFHALSSNMIIFKFSQSSTSCSTVSPLI
jgi:hypothetical protein